MSPLCPQRIRVVDLIWHFIVLPFDTFVSRIPTVVYIPCYSFNAASCVQCKDCDLSCVCVCKSWYILDYPTDRRLYLSQVLNSWMDVHIPCCLDTPWSSTSSPSLRAWHFPKVNHFASYYHWPWIRFCDLQMSSPVYCPCYQGHLVLVCHTGLEPVTSRMGAQVQNHLTTGLRW